MSPRMTSLKLYVVPCPYFARIVLSILDIPLRRYSSALSASAPAVELAAVDAPFELENDGTYSDSVVLI